MAKSFDLTVIGTGSAAAGVASRCRDSCWFVAIVDSRPYGGTCALRGCDPKKVLVGATEALDFLNSKSCLPGSYWWEGLHILRVRSPVRASWRPGHLTSPQCAAAQGL